MSKKRKCKIVVAKEQAYQTTAYHAECPECGDTFESTQSMAGETHDCCCGAAVEIVKP